MIIIGLHVMLNDANQLISSLKAKIMSMESQLNEQYKVVDCLSYDLCFLRNRLLKDGLTKYLEKV